MCTTNEEVVKHHRRPHSHVSWERKGYLASKLVSKSVSQSVHHVLQFQLDTAAQIMVVLFSLQIALLCPALLLTFQRANVSFGVQPAFSIELFVCAKNRVCLSFASRLRYLLKNPSKCGRWGSAHRPAPHAPPLCCWSERRRSSPPPSKWEAAFGTPVGEQTAAARRQGAKWRASPKIKTCLPSAPREAGGGNEGRAFSRSVFFWRGRLSSTDRNLIAKTKPLPRFPLWVSGGMLWCTELRAGWGWGSFWFCAWVFSPSWEEYSTTAY